MIGQTHTIIPDFDDMHSPVIPGSDNTHGLRHSRLRPGIQFWISDLYWLPYQPRNNNAPGHAIADAAS